MNDFRWMLDGDINIREDDSGGVIVVDAEADEACAVRSVRLTYREGALLFNNCFVDVGDDFPRFLGIMDAAAEGATFIGDCLSRPRAGYVVEVIGPVCAYWTEEDAVICGHQSCYTITEENGYGHE